jgi:hypothetical protein
MPPKPIFDTFQVKPPKPADVLSRTFSGGSDTPPTPPRGGSVIVTPTPPKKD